MVVGAGIGGEVAGRLFFGVRMVEWEVIERLSLKGPRLLDMWTVGL